MKIKINYIYDGFEMNDIVGVIDKNTWGKMVKCVPHDIMLDILSNDRTFNNKFNNINVK